MPLRILSGFRDSVDFGGFMALCFFLAYVIYRENFFSVQLLLHFSRDFDETSAEVLSSRAVAHIIRVL